MLEIKVNLTQNSVQMSGHAGYGEIGKDIVCSAASILFYTLAQTVENLKSGLKKPPRIRIGDDEKNINCFLSCKPKDEYVINFQTVYYTAVTGFQLLAESYPDNVTLKFIE